MARRRQFVKGAAAISQKRLTSWFQFVPAQVVMTATGGTIMFSLNAAALALRPFTIVRTRLELMLRSDQSAAVEQQGVAFGLAVVSDQASAVGVTAVPTPDTDMASDLWFVHQIVYADESNLTDRTRPQTRVSVDSKAMRKVDIGQDIVVVAELIASVSSGVTFVAGGRMLVKVN